MPHSPPQIAPPGTPANGDSGWNDLMRAYSADAPRALRNAARARRSLRALTRGKR